MGPPKVSHKVQNLALICSFFILSLLQYIFFFLDHMCFHTTAIWKTLNSSSPALHQTLMFPLRNQQVWQTSHHTVDSSSSASIQSQQNGSAILQVSHFYVRML